MRLLIALLLIVTPAMATDKLPAPCKRLAESMGVTRTLTPGEIEMMAQLLKNAEQRAEAQGITLNPGALKDLKACRSQLDK